MPVQVALRVRARIETSDAGEILHRRRCPPREGTN